MLPIISSLITVLGLLVPPPILSSPPLLSSLLSRLPSPSPSPVGPEMPRPKRNHGPCREDQEGERTPQRVEPASYHSFIDLTNFHHGAERGGQSSRARSARRRPRLLQVVDRPSSFLDLDDAQILDHPPHIPSLPFENAHDAGLVSAMPPSLVVDNCERGQGKPEVVATNAPGPSSGGTTSIERTTRHGTSFFSVWSTPQSCDLPLEIIPPYSHRAPLCLEDDRLPSYEDAAGSAPFHSGGNTVVLPARPPQRVRRPLPPIPRSRQGHVVFTTPLDTGGQPLHVDERNIVPPKCLSKLEKALL